MLKRALQTVALTCLTLALSATNLVAQQPQTRPAPTTQPVPPPVPEPPPLSHYERVGGAPQAVVLLHGLGSDSTVWKDAVAALKDKYTVVTIDFRGHGQTPVLPAAAPRAQALGQLTNDVRSIVEKEQLGRVVLVGHDMGGMVALQYAMRFAPLTRMAILVDADLHTPLSKEQLDEATKQIEADPKAFIEQRWTSPAISMDPATAARIRAQALKTDPAFFTTLFKEISQSHLERVLLNMPVAIRLIYQPGPASEKPAQDYLSEAGYSGAKNFRSERLERVGHFVMLDAPPLFQKALDGFLGDLPAPLKVEEAGVVAKPSGLKCIDVKPGDGAAATDQSRVTIEYSTFFLDGDEFSSLKTSEPQPMRLDFPNIMTGMKEGLVGMKVGGERKLIIPAELQRGAPMPRMPAALDTAILMNVKLVDAVEPPPLPPIDAAKEVALPSGVKYVETVAGDGPAAAENSTVKLHLSMWLANGKFVADTHQRPDSPPQVIPLTMLKTGSRLKGLIDASVGAKVGARRVATLPPELAYGTSDQVVGGIPVPANSSVVLECEFMEIHTPPSFEKPADSELTAAASGVKYKDVRVGDGKAPTAGDLLGVNVVGWSSTDGETGQVIDSSYEQGAPRRVTLEGPTAPPGWAEGLAGMKVGGRRILVIPPDFGLKEPPPASVPANPTKIYNIELVDVLTLPKFELPKDDELTTTPSGLKYKDIKVGEGDTPKPESKVKVKYIGWLTNGTPFDSSYQRGEPIEFGLNAVIKGWTEGVGSMRVGGQRILVIPPDLAYKEQAQGQIPPNSTLVFHVELVGIAR